jgi:hypothetical protein
MNFLPKTLVHMPRLVYKISFRLRSLVTEGKRAFDESEKDKEREKEEEVEFASQGGEKGPARS